MVITNFNQIKQRKITLLSIIIVVAAVGTILLLGSHAETPYISAEAESGSLSGAATKISDSTASGSGAVQFGNASATTTSSTNLNGQMGVSLGTWAFTYEGLTSAEQETALTNMVNDGVKWVRVDVDSNNGDLPFIKAAEAKGINILAILEADGATTATPASMASLAIHEVLVLKPYGVEDYEVLNEPNGCAYQLTASAYTDILKSVYPALKTADAKSFVVAGGLCPNSGSNEPYTFLTAMYAAGAHGYFDALNDHPYSFPDTPLDSSDASNPWSYLPQMRATMVANGDSNKQIWLTEYGCPTGSLNDGYPAECSQAEEAEDITDAYQQVKAMPYIGPFFVYDWQDAADDFGLYNSDGTAKTAPLAAFMEAAGK
jgi:hypothetical protein